MEKLSLKNPELFNDLIFGVDNHMSTVMGKVVRGDFESGEVTVKIKLACEYEEVKIPRAGSDFEIKKYKKPVIKYSIKSNLKQSFSNENSVVTDNYMVDAKDNSVMLKRMDEDQLSMLGDIDD
ncbi:hypothetical protein [Anaerococcus marasmi]|uniref:hypothetical protein n=1 Tax=Anaerococcus marasmi TaxID=2057797 RepID=UPI001F07DE9A|nr:hypothetical protein [Anaerococcus marasmi]